MPTHGSFFSGIGGFDLGFERAGFRTVFQSEIDPFASSILRRHFPDVPNLGDITKLEDVPDADVWTGGFPCQDLSVAGRRAGLLGGSRSILALEFLRLARARRPAWIILENVPGLFTSNGGEDFATLLDALEELGYFVAWRTLDARYFGVPQRRRRVFIVGGPTLEGAGAVLALEASGERDPYPLDEAWPSAAADLVTALQATMRWGRSRPVRTASRHPSRSSSKGSSSSDLSSLPQQADGDTTRTPPPEGISSMPRAFVRRTTPVEWERLQGFPDGWTIPDRGGSPAGRKRRKT